MSTHSQTNSKTLVTKGGFALPTFPTMEEYLTQLSQLEDSSKFSHVDLTSNWPVSYPRPDPKTEVLYHTLPFTLNNVVWAWDKEDYPSSPVNELRIMSSSLVYQVTYITLETLKDFQPALTKEIAKALTDAVAGLFNDSLSQAEKRHREQFSTWDTMRMSPSEALELIQSRCPIETGYASMSGSKIHDLYLNALKEAVEKSKAGINIHIDDALEIDPRAGSQLDLRVSSKGSDWDLVLIQPED